MLESGGNCAKDGYVVVGGGNIAKVDIREQGEED